MAELRIIVGDKAILQSELGDLAVNLEIVGGDTRLIWDAGNTDEVDSARATFERLTGKGYAAFGVKKDGGKGEKIAKFDSELEKIILAPATRGG